MENVLKVRNVSKIYQSMDSEVIALSDINFNVKQSEFISIIGPSGCGKSTLLSIIAGIEKKSNGEIYIDDELVEGISEKIGYMLQTDCLLEWRTIFNNCLLGIEIKRKVTEEDKKYVKYLLEKYKLSEFKDKYPSELSGGMRQRVALIRTLAIKPKILLLDEAFSALDYQTRIMVTNDIYSILKEDKITVLMVTHDISEAISMSDEIIVLTKRPAKIMDIVNIEFDKTSRTPLNCRQNSKFSIYFDKLWKELNSND